MVAKHIKVTTKTEVVVKTAKSSVVKTAEDALRIADKFGLKARCSSWVGYYLVHPGPE